MDLEIVIFLFPLYLSMLFKKRPLERELAVFFSANLALSLACSLYCCQLSCQGLQPHFTRCCCPHVDIISSTLLARRKGSASLHWYCCTVYRKDSGGDFLHRMASPFSDWCRRSLSLLPQAANQNTHTHTQKWKNIPWVITTNWAQGCKCNSGLCPTTPWAPIKILPG